MSAELLPTVEPGPVPEPPTPTPASGPAGSFEPVILGFTCNWCSYRAADLAGTARLKYPPNVRLIRLMCSGRLDPAFVLKAFAEGADGVVVSGCWPGECHYQVQNLKALRRFRLLRRVIAGFGIEPERLQLVWASAAEGQRLANELGRVTAEIRALGPLRGLSNESAEPPGPDSEPAAPESDPATPALELAEVAQ